MKGTFLSCLLNFIALYGMAQPLGTLNYDYIYHPEPEVSFSVKLVRSNSNCNAVFTAVFNNDLFASSDFEIRFETRQSLGDKEGTLISVPVATLATTNKILAGRFNFPVTSGKIFVALVTKIPANEHFYFWRYIPEYNTPYIVSGGILNTHPYLTTDSNIRLGGFQSDLLVCSYYGNDFPAAAPPFAIKQGYVPGIIKPDSIYTLRSTDEQKFTESGLYLIQSDTTSESGLAFRKENDYPKFATIESLIGPLIYICTRQEYDKLQRSNGEKKKFDQVILGITGDTDRAKNFMRTFYYRVELANNFFSSYKEGWKTDRGMIFIIYGLPSEVYLFEDREVWEYRSDGEKETFVFTRSATVFDPENFVLIRNKKYEDTWYRSIDLWRKSRF